MNLKSKQYYDLTKNVKPHKILEDFIKLNVMPSNAIDLGCGAGRDTVFLLKNNWQVTSIDKEDTREYITEQLSETDLKGFQFQQQTFDTLKLNNTNLIVANFSLHFCNETIFPTLWNKISSSINKDRIFCWQLFG